MRLFGDSTTASDIPATVDGVLVYVDGAFAWSDGDRARFAGKPQVEIVTDYRTNAGSECDVETGDLTPQQAIWWVQMRRAAGMATPTVYCAESSWPYIKQAFADAGVAEPLWHIAGYDDSAVIPEGAVAKQYANQDFTGGHYDLSVVADYWPGVDPATEDDMFSDNDRSALMRVLSLLSHGDQTQGGGSTADPRYLGDRLDNIDDAVNRILANTSRLEPGQPGDPNALGDALAEIKAALAELKAAGVAPHTHNVTGTAQ